MKNRLCLLISILLTTVHLTHAQKNVSITIDDVPNTIEFLKNRPQSSLVKKLDSLAIPIAIFINEGLIYKGDSIYKNFELLKNWIIKDYISLGNHTYNHSRYSTVGFDAFKSDILKGTKITSEISKKYKKSLIYFRFPYNDLGKDSIQHKRIKVFLINNGYKIAPFTIESSDWMYNRVYKYYIEKKNLEKAKEIGNKYVNKTLEYFEFFDYLSRKKYGRSINQIFLCHDNKLNSDYLDLIIKQLKLRKYNFISLEKALSDDAYKQKDTYYKKWGISWFYRWLNSQEDRVKLMKKEPSTDEIETLFDNISN